MPPYIDPTRAIFIGVCLILLVAFLLIFDFKVAKIRSKDLARASLREDGAVRQMNRAIAFLERIRDMGPSGPDPLPPCRFCKQGAGHWTRPVDETCPAVVAWRAVRALQQPEENPPEG